MIPDWIGAYLLSASAIGAKQFVVQEAAEMIVSKEKAQAHINAGARKVVISAPAGNDLPTIVYNTNHDTRLDWSVLVKCICHWS